MMKKLMAVVLMMAVASVASAGSIAVDNASFETGDFTDWTINAAGLDSVKADGEPWPAAYAPDGTYYAYLRGATVHYMTQDTVAIDAAETYTLSAQVGVQHTWSQSYNMTLYAWDGVTETLLAETGVTGMGGSNPEGTTWVADSVSAGPAELAGYGGQTLRIRLENHSGGEGSLYDAVTLEDTGAGAAPIPEPAGLGFVGLALLAVRKRRS